MIFDIFLCLFRQGKEFLLILIQFYNRVGEVVWFVFDDQYVFDARDAFASDGGGDDGGAVLDGFYNFSFDAGAVAERNYYDAAGAVKLGQLFFGDEAFDDDAASRLL